MSSRIATLVLALLCLAPGTRALSSESCGTLGDRNLATMRLWNHEIREKDVGVYTIVPWPGIYGTWSNRPRDLWITVRAYDGGQNQTWVLVEFRSICTGRVLARGTRYLVAKDWDSPNLRISMRNYTSQDPDAYTMSLTPPSEDQPGLGVKIYDHSSGSIDPVGNLTDSFYAVRP